MDAGPVRRTPSRSCVACRTARPKRELVRVVRRPDGHVEIDETGRTPGRGAYVCRDTACLDRAIAKGALGRALSLRLPAGIRDDLAAHITNHDESTIISTLNTEGGARGQE